MRIARFDNATSSTPVWLELDLHVDEVHRVLEATPSARKVYVFGETDLETFLEFAKALRDVGEIRDLKTQGRTAYKRKPGTQTIPLKQVFRRARLQPAALRARYERVMRLVKGIDRLVNAPLTEVPQVCLLGVSPEILGQLAEMEAASFEDARLRSVQCAFTGTSPGTALVQRRIVTFAPCSHPVLILGESGTGKEVVARMLHEHSSGGPFIPLNCAEFAPGLIEDELFGHEPGAYTGAKGQRRGLIELASGGTLFIDEIGEMPLETQAKLLRVLQERVIRRVGGSEFIPVDVRVLAATSRDIFAMMAEGSFRRDLFYRLAVLQIPTPRLGEDRSNFAQHVRRLWLHWSPRRELSEGVVERLWAYDWPGNVRQLETVLTQLAIEYETDPTVEDVERVLLEKTTGRVILPGPGGPLRRSKAAWREDVEGFSAVRPSYAWLADAIHGISKREAQNWSPPPILHPWTLKVASLARLKREETCGSVVELPDLCGLRVIVATRDQKRELLARLGRHLLLEGDDIPTDLSDKSFYPVTCRVRIDEVRVPGLASALGVAVPAEVIGRQAEVQVFTLLEAAWVSLKEDVVDDEGTRQELEVLEWTISLGVAEADDVLRAGQLAARFGRWPRAIELLSPHVREGGHVTRDLGLVLCKSNPPKSEGHERGLALLREACSRSSEDSDVTASGIKTWKRSGRDLYARDFYHSDLAATG